MRQRNILHVCMPEYGVKRRLREGVKLQASSSAFDLVYTRIYQGVGRTARVYGEDPRRGRVSRVRSEATSSSFVFRGNPLRFRCVVFPTPALVLRGIGSRIADAANSRDAEYGDSWPVHAECQFLNGKKMRRSEDCEIRYRVEFSRGFGGIRGRKRAVLCSPEFKAAEFVTNEKQRARQNERGLYIILVLPARAATLPAKKSLVLVAVTYKMHAGWIGD
ncbi:hypothetical protein C8F01DRAFT_1075460 [Mycena amicta]|nr:hypothetical protein C8F01DRAFT_1075460 [Mycena amicta]